MSKEIFHDKLKKRLDELGIKTKRPEKIETILNAIDELVNPLELEKSSISNIKQSLDMFDSTELIDLRDDITNKISNKMIKDDDILKAFDYIEKKGQYTHITYKELYKYMYSQGVKKEYLDIKLIQMYKEHKIRQVDGCPLGWEHTTENPIYPEVKGEKYLYFCYLAKPFKEQK